MKSRVIASIFSILAFLFLPNAVDSAASINSIVSCRSVNNPTDDCTFQRAKDLLTLFGHNSTDLLTWFDHNLTATQMGCSLASIINSEEQAQVQALYDNKTGLPRLWIGAFKAQDGEWQWSDGSVFSYTNWNPGEPSNQTTETHAHIMFPDDPDNKMKWNNRSPNETQSAVYKCCVSNKRSFEVCATSDQYTPSPILVYNETTGESYPTFGGSWGYDYTIYKNSAKGLDIFNDANTIPLLNATTNITVYVNRNDNNTCTVHVKTAQMPETTPGGDAVDNGVVCNSCTWCGNDHWSQYSADCTNIEHGRMVECESADVVFFPLTEAALDF
jgi:hypothetical protein